LPRREKALDRGGIVDTLLSRRGPTRAQLAPLRAQRQETEMNRWNMAKLAGAGLIALTLSGLEPRVASAEPERRLETALRFLQNAREELRDVRGDKGGHREQALDFTVRAIRQVEEAINSERRDRRDDHRDRH